MAREFETTVASRHGVLRCGLLLLLGLVSFSLQAAVSSDLLIVLDPDGRHYVAQHTVTSDSTLVIVELPAERISLETRFSGPERLTFTTAHELNPDQLTLWSGSALTRYRHRYGQGLRQPLPYLFELDTQTEHRAMSLEQASEVHWSLTWILPANASLADFNVTALPLSNAAGSDMAENASAGRWQSSGQVITYRQSGGQLPALKIRFSLDDYGQAGDDPCPDITNGVDHCAADVDGDEVPDTRDLCLPPASAIATLPAPDSASPRVFAASQDQAQPDALGCDHENPLVLSGIRFRSGLSYLDVASREVLDRVARALQRIPDQLFEISAHTDNAGRVETNQRLSENRARAVRHYLLLRGVNTGQIRARGYGETMPAFDNTVAAGRRANRRTELRRLN